MAAGGFGAANGAWGGRGGARQQRAAGCSLRRIGAQREVLSSAVGFGGPDLGLEGRGLWAGGRRAARRGACRDGRRRYPGPLCCCGQG